MTYGFTEMEARAIGPRTIEIRRKQIDWAGVAGYVLLFAIVLGLLGQFVIVPMIPVQSAICGNAPGMTPCIITPKKVSTLSDHDQEVEYCQQIFAGEKQVQGANTAQLAAHCSHYIN